MSASAHTRFYLATCVQCSHCLLTHANLLKVYPSTGAQKRKRPSLGLSQQGRSWGPGAGDLEPATGSRVGELDGGKGSLDIAWCQLGVRDAQYLGTVGQGPASAPLLEVPLDRQAVRSRAGYAQGEAKAWLQS